MKRAVFLDRDNTIIQNDGDLGNPEDVRLIRGAAHAIGSLRQLGYRIIVVSNQGGVARGRYTERDVDAVHERIAQMVHDSAGAIIDRFYYCPFHPQGTVAEYTKEHPWRKPQPGMLLEAARSLDLKLSESWMVGNEDRDVEAGRAAGCQTILITRKTSVNTKADFQASSLAEAAAIIAQNRVRPRQAAGPAPTIVVSPKVSAEPRPAPVVAEQSQAGAATARAEPIERFSSAAVPKSRALPEQTLDDAPPADERVEEDVEAAVESVEEQTREGAAEHAAVPQTAESDAAEAETETEAPVEHAPPPRRRDPFRHIPIRVLGIEPPRQERGESQSNSDRLLTETLGEIRSWRHSQREFTPSMMMISLASIALVIVAVLLSVYLEPATATPWIGATIVAQLSVIAFIVLNFRR